MMNKSEWHRANKWEYHRYVNGKCAECSEYFEKHEGCIHHNTYRHKGGIYNAGWRELHILGKINWVCHSCHEDIHCREQIDGITKILTKHILPICNNCGEEIYTAEDMQTCDMCNNQ